MLQILHRAGDDIVMSGTDNDDVLSGFGGSHTPSGGNGNDVCHSDDGRDAGYGTTVAESSLRGARALLHAITGLLLLTMLAAGAVRADVASSEATDRVQALTRSLASMAARFATASRSNRGALRAQLLDLAPERRTALLELVEDAPGEVLKAELPSRIVRRLPAEVRGLLEYRGAIEGELQVVQIDHEDLGKSYLKYGLVTVYGEYVALHFAGAPTHRLTGDQVIAHGLILEGEAETAMVLDSEDDLDVAYCCESDGDSTSEPELSNTLGAQSTAVLLVNFVDDLSQPWTVTEAQDMVFGQVSDWFYEVSHNQTWLEATRVAVLH